MSQSLHVLVGVLSLMLASLSRMNCTRLPSRPRTWLVGLLLLLCAAGAQAAPAFPVKYSADKRYLVDQAGTPFPILGRTAWFVVSLPVIDYKTFIDDTVARGYTAIELHVLNHDPRGNRPPFNGNGDAPFLKRLDGTAWDGTLSGYAPDFTTPNEAYWSFVDGLLAYCESKGVLVFMFPAYVGYQGGDQGWMQEMVANGSARMRSYGAWIAARYANQKNLVWMMGGDMGSFNSAQQSAEDGLLAGLKSVGGQQSTLFSAEWSSEMIATDQATFGSSMTLNGVYSFSGDVNTCGRRAYAHSPVEPAFLLEEPYDQEGPDGNGVNGSATQPVRRFQWWGFLSTIGGYISGNGYVWPFRAPDWRNHLDTQGSRDMARLNAFIVSIPWYSLVPSGLGGMRTLITAGGSAVNASDYVAASATPQGTLLVAYIPPAHSGSITVDMGAMSGPSRARWFDPTSGTYTSIGSGLVNSGTREFTPPGSNSVGQKDWTLVLDTAGTAGSPSPPIEFPTHALTVINGTGTGDYTESTRVTVSANAPAPGQEFDRWTGDYQILDNPLTPTTTALMLFRDLTINASYRTSDTIRYLPRAGYTARMVGGVFEGTDGNPVTGPYTPIYTITTTPPARWSQVPVSLGSYRYLRYRGAPGSYCNVMEIEFYRAGVKLKGTGYGSPGTWPSGVYTFAKALDGDINTQFCGPTPNGNYVGIDTAAIGNKIRFLPRAGYTARMVGGVFEGTDGNPVTGPYTPIYTITTTPPAGWSEVPVSLGSYRYLRYRGAPGSYCNVMEIEFYRAGVKLEGTGYGSPGTWPSGVYTFAKALDGDINTQFCGPTPNGNYVGIDTAAIGNKIRFLPRAGYTARMVGGVFEGTDGNPVTGPYTPIYTITTTPPAGWSEVPVSLGSYRYLRYRGAPGSYCNVMEIEFYRAGVKLEGTGYGSPGTWPTGVYTFAKALDGDINTQFCGPTPNGNYVGIDTAGSMP